MIYGRGMLDQYCYENAMRIKEKKYLQNWVSGLIVLFSEVENKF